MILTRTIVLSFLILMMGLAPALAQTEVTETPVEATPSQATPARTDSERTITLQARTQTRITNLAANISNRLDAYIFRLQNIATRFGTRLDKLEANGIDVTIARASLARAQTSLDAAALEMSDIDERVALVTGSPKPREAWREVQQSYLRTRDHIRTAFNELRTVMIDIRGALNNPTPPQVETPTIEESTN